jgi:hypothetical protein
MALPTVQTQPPLFRFQLRVLALTDEVPGRADQAALVSTSARISIAGTPTDFTNDPSTAVFQTHTNYPGPVPVVVSIERHTRGLTIHGSVQREHGQWYWIGGGQRIPLAPDDPCVTRVWPGGRSMSDADFARFCRTRTISASVNPGTVWTINLSYDLASEQIDGDLSGPAGKVFDLHRDLSTNGQIHLRFVMNALDVRGFARDIRPLFRDSDVEAMKSPVLLPVRIDLSSYEDVRQNAQSIDIALNASETGGATHMPCNGWWPPGPRLVFKQWMDQRMPP